MSTRGTGSKTQNIANGASTHSPSKFSFLAVANKDPKFDYSFQLRSRVEQGGGVTPDGWAPVGKGNESGEKAEGPTAWFDRSTSHGITYEDVILCRRPKEVTAMVRRYEAQKYNAHLNLIRKAAGDVQDKFRNIERAAGLTERANVNLEQVSGVDDYKQVAGPTQG